MRIGEITHAEGYYDFDEPMAVVVGSSRSKRTLTVGQAAHLLDEHLDETLPDGRVKKDRWHAVIKGDPVGESWHSNGSGAGWRDVVIFETLRGRE